MRNGRAVRERKVAHRSAMPDFAGTEGFYLWEDRAVRLRPEPPGEGVVRRALVAAGLTAGDAR